MAMNHRIDPTTKCEAIRDLIPEYAFGLSSPDEQRLVEANLADCPDARAQLAEFMLLQDEMRADVREVAPPTDLEARIMAAAIPSLRVLPTPPRSGRRIWQLAAVAAVIALVASNIFWAIQVNTISQQKNDLSAQLAQLTSGSPSNTLVLNSTLGLRWVRLPPSQQNTDTVAFMMWNAESKIGLLYATNFPKLTAGTTYQLWLTRNDVRTSVGVFVVDEQGKGALLFHSEEPIDKFTWAWITTEPGNGSPSPSEEIVVKGKLST